MCLHAFMFLTFHFVAGIESVGVVHYIHARHDLNFQYTMHIKTCVGINHYGALPPFVLMSAEIHRPFRHHDSPILQHTHCTTTFTILNNCAVVLTNIFADVHLRNNQSKKHT